MRQCNSSLSFLFEKKKDLEGGGEGDRGYFPGAPKLLRGLISYHDFYLYGLHLSAGGIQNLLINLYCFFFLHNMVDHASMQWVVFVKATSTRKTQQPFMVMLLLFFP